MKKLLIILTLLPALIACQSDTYFHAMNTNVQRFDGWQEENALFMVETHDMALLIEDLAQLAKRRAKLRETYLLAEDVENHMAELQTYYLMEATIQRVKLSSSLSEDHDKILHRLEEVSDDNFDAVFSRYLQSELRELNERAMKYKSKGHNERIKALADRIIDSINNIREEYGQIS